MPLPWQGTGLMNTGVFPPDFPQMEFELPQTQRASGIPPWEPVAQVQA